MGIIKYIYQVPIIDFWNGWHPLFQEEYRDADKRLCSCRSDFFANVIDFFYKLSKHSDWDGNLRDNSELYVYPHESINFVVGLKQESDGLTFIGTSSPINFSNDIFLLDEGNFFDEYTGLVYEFKEPVILQYSPMHFDATEKTF